jgi:hypothetical protein
MNIDAIESQSALVGPTGLWHNDGHFDAPVGETGC